MEVTAERVYAWIRRVVERERRHYTPSRIHVSEVAGCLRRAYYDRVAPMPALDPSNVVMLLGSGLHEKLQGILSRDGWVPEYRVSRNLGDFTLEGHIDLYHPRERVALELKTVGKIPDKPYRSHGIQANTYHSLAGARRTYIVYIARDGDVRVYPVRFSERLLQETIDRARILREAILEKRAPPRERGPWCKSCPYKWRCYTGGWEP